MYYHYILFVTLSFRFIHCNLRNNSTIVLLGTSDNDDVGDESESNPSTQDRSAKVMQLIDAYAN